MAGGGADIWNAADQFNFASSSFISDGTITAQITSLQNSDPGSGWSKAGVMFRNDTTAGSANVCLAVSATEGINLQWRDTNGDQSMSINIGGITAPVWLQLVRSGDNFTGYYSNDGTNWTQVGSQQIYLNGSVLAGLAVTAHNDSALNTATFTNVNLYLAGLWGLPAVLGEPQLKHWRHAGRADEHHLQSQLAQQSVCGLYAHLHQF